MSVKTKFFISSIIMLVLPVFLMVLISAFILVLLAGYFPGVAIEIKGLAPTLYNPLLRRYVMLWIIVLIIVVAGCCAGVTAYLTKTILAPLKGMSDAMEHLTSGDLDCEILSSGDGEIREVYDAIERLRLRLKLSVSDEIMREEEHRMLIANISHDLKTPITSIKGYVEGLRDGVAANPAMTKRYLDTILAKADTLHTMVNNLSLYSKLNAGSEYDIKEYNILDFAAEVLDEYEIDLKNAGMTAALAGESLTSAFDRAKMKRVFSNVIENAVKYKNPDAGGSISITVSRDGDFAVIAFADTGIGISEDDEKRVFETFFRADKARNMNVSGNGLGLSICDRIVREHGGRMWMRGNGENPGATVYIRLKISDGNKGERKD